MCVREVTAKSMFRQFGSRVIQNGRRVRDDYWESKARKQGFTEDDLAGEKRPAEAKSREAAAAEIQLHAMPAFAQGNIVFSNGPVFDGLHPHQLPPGLAATLGPSMLDLTTSKNYSNIQRPRQEMTGVPFQERSQPSSATEIMNQAQQTSEFTSPDQLTWIRSQLMSDFGLSDRQEICFYLRWNLLGFCEKELDGSKDLAQVLTITGSGKKAFATTCEDYINMFWPQNGAQLLESLQHAMKSSQQGKVPYKPFNVNR
jgi:Chromatin remodelling complex Rsc7/Swp82 subunit